MAKVYSAEDVAKHNSKGDLWVSIHGKVYDLTSYAEDHPGGVESLMEVAGQDGTTAFEDLGHSGDARETMERFCVGKLDHDEEDVPQMIPRNLSPVPLERPMSWLSASSMRTLTDILSTSMMVVVGFVGMRRFCRSTTASRWHVPDGVLHFLPWALSSAIASTLSRRLLRRIFPADKQQKRPAHFKIKTVVAPQRTPNHACLDPRQFIDLPVTSIEKLSHNSNRIILDLPTKTSVLGLPVGQHISIRANVNGAPVSRSYTPTSCNKDLGRLELVIKNYDTGLLTGNYLKDVQIGDKVSISGPRGQMRYRRGLAKAVGMIAGGTGITPMFQLIRGICEDKRDDTKIVLLYANQKEEDILLKSELDAFVEGYGDQLEVHYMLSKPSAGWAGGVGRVSKELIQKCFAPAADKENKVMVCGPQGMVDNAKEWLVELGYDRANAVSKMTDQVFIF